jgi:hypothetical protein
MPWAETRQDDAKLTAGSCLEGLSPMNGLAPLPRRATVTESDGDARQQERKHSGLCIPVRACHPRWQRGFDDTPSGICCRRQRAESDRAAAGPARTRQPQPAPHLAPLDAFG